MWDSWIRRAFKTRYILDELREKYAKAAPFQHIVLDNVFLPTSLFTLEYNVPKPDESWWKYDNLLERKYAKDNLADDHFSLREAISLLQSRQFTDFLEAVTGISGLIVDQTLRGGGLHQIARGGKLDVHADYNVHPVTKLDRRLNVLLYLNSNWRPEWGGSLELWDKDMTRAVQAIQPLLGRMVIFSTTDTAFHGHPDPLTCPDGITRKSIALYYYTNGRPQQERSAPHSTLYQRRPQDPVHPATEILRNLRAQGRVPNTTETKK